MTNSPSNSDNPLTRERMASTIRDLTTSGQELINAMSMQVNDIQFERALQMGYMMACQDFGLPVPDFKDPVQNLPFKV